LDPAKSILDLENLKAQYPKEPAILEKLAFVYAKEIKSADNKINLQNAEKAVQTYQELIQIDPKRVSAYNNTANIYYTMGHELEAIEFWEKAVHVDPTFLDAQLNLGKILYVKGKLKEAASHFESVLKIEPGNSEAIVYLKRMVE
jgi:tetratricopeptide (TPR) repeat protein